MVCITEGLRERFVINVSEHEQQEEVVWTHLTCGLFACRCAYSTC
jgi:hypothetical protein